MLDVSLHAHVAEYEQRGAHWRLGQRRGRRDEERDTEVSLNAVGEVPGCCGGSLLSSHGSARAAGPLTTAARSARATVAAWPSPSTCPPDQRFEPSARGDPAVAVGGRV